MPPVRPYQTQDPATAAILAGQDTVKARARAALAANATFLALPAPTAAQAVAQVAMLTRQVNGMIRLLLGATDDLTGT